MTRLSTYVEIIQEEKISNILSKKAIKCLNVYLVTQKYFQFQIRIHRGKHRVQFFLHPQTSCPSSLVGEAPRHQ